MTGGPSPLLRPAGRFDAWEPTPARLVALDVDGTLVGTDGSVSDAVVAAVAHATAAGLHVGLATGRMALGVTDVLARTGMHGPHMLHNGAQVVLDGATLVSWPVPRDALQRALDGCRDAGVYLEVYVEDGYLVTAMDERARDHWTLLGHDPLGVVRDADDVDGEVAKVTAAVFAGEDVARVVAVLEAAGLRAGAAGSPATPHIRYVNGTDQRADKGAALRAAAAALDVPLAATVAVGDAGNDLPLLAVAGTAIAMGQAPDDVRRAAHLTTGSVGEDGAAMALRAAADGWPSIVASPAAP